MPVTSTGLKEVGTEQRRSRCGVAGGAGAENEHWRVCHGFRRLAHNIVKVKSSLYVRWRNSVVGPLNRADRCGGGTIDAFHRLISTIHASMLLLLPVPIRSALHRWPVWRGALVLYCSGDAGVLHLLSATTRGDPGWSHASQLADIHNLVAVSAPGWRTCCCSSSACLPTGGRVFPAAQRSGATGANDDQKS